MSSGSPRRRVWSRAAGFVRANRPAVRLAPVGGRHGLCSQTPNPVLPLQRLAGDHPPGRDDVRDSTATLDRDRLGVRTPSQGRSSVGKLPWRTRVGSEQQESRASKSNRTRLSRKSATPSTGCGRSRGNVRVRRCRIRGLRHSKLNSYSGVGSSSRLDRRQRRGRSHKWATSKYIFRS
jgi:hypothetical protein